MSTYYLLNTVHSKLKVGGAKHKKGSLKTVKVSNAAQMI
jgi:hypothetical protein